MPYVNRYFHKRDPVIPYKHWYDVKAQSKESMQENKMRPKHVVTYEYDLALGAKNNSRISNSFNRVTKTKNNPNYDDQKQYYSNKKYFKEEIKLPHDFIAASNVCAKIKSPSGKIHYCDIIDYDSNHFNIRFTPTEIGEHNVSIKQGHLHVAGSPFKIIVGSIESGALQDIQIYGTGIEGGYTDEVNKFLIYLKNTGHGKLTVTIDGSSKAIINLTEKENGAYDVEYKIPTSGSYLCSIKFNDKHVPGSPFKMNLENRIQEKFFYSNRDHHINLSSIQNQGIAKIGRPVSLTLNQNGLKNNLMRAYVISPTNRKENVRIKSLENDQFSLRIEPKERGLHKVHVLLDEVPIHGSPFEVMVGDIVAFGKGLFEANVEEVSNFKLDTKNAEPGLLNVTIEGPSKVELNCFELDDGYEFTYCPTIPGDYILSLKYQNNHIQGSPFMVKIYENKRSTEYSPIIYQKALMVNATPLDMQSYPEGLRCRGDGIIKALVGRNNEFLVDASSGGAGILYVAISGPTKPCEEINIKHIGGKRFQINYFVHEYGKHLIFIRWNDKEIPGSPFPVYVH